MGKRGRPLDPRMLVDTRSSIQKISLACGRKVDTYLLPSTRTYLAGYLAIEALYFFHVLWGCHFYYGSDLVRVSLDTSLGHHEP